MYLDHATIESPVLSVVSVLQSTFCASWRTPPSVPPWLDRRTARYVGCWLPLVTVRPIANTVSPLLSSAIGGTPRR